MQENPKLCKKISDALYINYFISQLDVQSLIEFIKGAQASPTLADSFHEEVMQVLKTKMSTEDVVTFIQEALEDKELLNKWFNNLGKENLGELVTFLTGEGDKTTSSKLSAYIANTKNLPNEMKEGKLSATEVLDIGDITIKVSYTAENGPSDFKEQVRAF